jgi:transposase
VKPDPLILSANQKKELFDFIKNTRNKEEYRRVVAVKQKMEGMSYRTIAKNLGVNHRNVYYMIKSYKERGLDGIRSKRKKECRYNTKDII